MDSSEDLRKAQALADGGRYRQSLAAGWRASEVALLNGDAEALRSVIDFASQIQQSTTGKVSRDAEVLANYCRHSLTGGDAVVESHSLLARLSRIAQPRRKCPDCAEKVPAEARVCRYCGFRFPSTDA